MKATTYYLRAREGPCAVGPCENKFAFASTQRINCWTKLHQLITLTNIVSGDPERKHVETPCLRHILMPQQRVLGLVAIFAKQAFFSSPRLSRGVSQTSCLQECQALYSGVAGCRCEASTTSS